MGDRTYDKATAVAIFRMTAWPDSYTVLDDGIFLDEGFRVHSPTDTVFDWTPAYDMDWPGSPNPTIAAVLPIPFTASELAACMLDGPGGGIQKAIDRRIGYSLDESGDALAGLPLRMREVRDALQNAYAIAANAQMIVGEFDYNGELEAQSLCKQFDDANGEANMREGVFEDGITSEERTLRRARAVESVADLKSRAEQARATVKAKWFSWRKAMVQQLLQPKAAPVDSDSTAPATKPQAKRASIFDAVLPYLRTTYENGKFKTVDEYLRELGKQSGTSDSPFKNSAVHEDSFFLVDGGKSVSHSVIRDRMKDIR